MEDSESHRTPVLIVGAGIVGLTLAHALKKNSIPFIIFERDPSPDSRPQGWGLTIHFALSELRSLLPDSINARIDSTQVDPSLKYDNGNFIFLNLESCTVKWRIPPTERKRISRDRFRQLLLSEGMADEVLWGKQLSSFAPTETGVKVVCSDGSSYEGLLLVGVDGSSSRVRSLLCTPEASLPTLLPVNFLGTSLQVSKSQIEPLLDIDPLLFQGCHPESSTYMWFSVIDTPETNGTISKPIDQQIWKIQICLSWPLSTDELEMPSSDAERVAIMKERTANFHPKLKSIFHDLLRSDHAPVTSLKLTDWYPTSDPWLNLDGRVTLAGDAAHTMTMYRGEGFNHAILDVYNLLPVLQHIYSVATSDIDGVRRNVISEYEKELKARGRDAVLMSRDACLEAHQWNNLNENSAILKRRAR